ncbi:flavin monoamine oxidase family protein [Actinoplanes sichuanensis]|uniref:Flavin monoamine oxidase family protein n=1 Tax=Actinoplanes sichuanensis TaxID=512349 RepID=A0ABW4A7H9_9ACTN|nr:FAD-dependent oxidoreductase [Actinoplanes sichuanensis]BEL03678.1 flavin monoamine oxidase family protein [Actinoplanes sichuanensis]
MSNGELTRRRFLTSVGVTGGAGALFATMGALGQAPARTPTPEFNAPRQADFHLTGRAARRVVILGGGIAGLTAAYELGKAGYDCTILEARDVAGGRNLTIRGGRTETDLDGHTQRADFSSGTYLNAGPARIAQWMVTLDYCRELGVPIQPFVNANADTLIYNEAAGAPVRFRTAKADVYGYVSELLAKATDQGALDTVLTAEDKARLLSFLEDFGDIGAEHDYVGSTRRGFSPYPGAGEDHGTPLPGPASLSDVFASEVGRYLSFEFGYDQAMMMFQPVGGMDRIAAALTTKIGPRRVRLGAQVTKITTRASDVTVGYRQDGRDQSITADFCIVALPPNVMTRVPHNLGPDITAALAAFLPFAAGKIGLEYRSRWWETDLRIYGGSTQTDLDIGQIWYPSHDFHAPRGLLVGYYNFGETAESYGSLSPAERTARALTQGAKIHGAKYRTELASSFSVAWNRTPHLEAAWNYAPWNDSTAFRLLLKPAGRVYFAGDWLSQAVAWQHGAFLSARATVTALHKRVLTA